MSEGVGPPESWRFVIPTIADRLPDLVPISTDQGRSVLSIFEDDWRQVDLLSRALHAEISECLSEIEKIRTEAGNDVGFGRVHTRTGLNDPLHDAAVSIEELVLAMGAPTRYIDYLKLEEYDGMVAHGYAFMAPGDITAYGTLDGSRVRTAGFQGDVRSLFGHPPGSLLRLLESKGLTIVNWLQSAVL